MRAEAQGVRVCRWTEVVQPMPAFRQKPVSPIEITEDYGPPIIWYDRLINLSMSSTPSMTNIVKAIDGKKGSL